MNSPSPAQDAGAVKLVLADHEWQYRGEGNAKIAISLLAEKKIVLLHKSTTVSDTNSSEFMPRISTNIRFINTIMKSLLGDVFVASASLVSLSSGEIQLLNETLAPIRPETRKDKELFFCIGEICDDHVYLPLNMSVFCKPKPLCVELKPKQGIFPESERHFRNCLFCRKQKLKMKNGLVLQQSSYCPLDLFSGSSVRMRRALLSLIHSPQNNLRIYHDGHEAYGEKHSDGDLQKVLMEWFPSIPKSSLVERFSSILLQALTKDFKCFGAGRESPDKWIFDDKPPLDLKVESHAGPEDNIPILSQPACNYDRQDLPEGCILHSLIQVQALDNLGTAAVNDMLHSHEEYTTAPDHSLKSSGTNYVNDILNKGCISKLNPIERYLIAAVARDCSILITFQETEDNCPEAQALPQVMDEDSKTIFLCHIAAVDLGPKPISCISSQMKKKASILQVCQQISEK